MSEEFETPRSRVEAILQNMLGAENVLPPPKSRIEYYLQKILEEGGGSSTFKTFNSDWVTDSTTAAFCASVNSDPEAVAGMAYLGELTCSDLPFNGNADAVVEIIDESGTSGKVIHIVITSGNIAPYRWEYTYWNDGANVSGWIAFATTDTVQANPTLEGTEPDLTGLVVNGVKYKAGGGGSEQHLYQHEIVLERTSNPSAYTTILSNNPMPMTYLDIWSFLDSNGFNDYNKGYSCCGLSRQSQKTTASLALRVYDSETLTTIGYSADAVSTDAVRYPLNSTTIRDTVIQIL